MTGILFEGDQEAFHAGMLRTQAFERSADT